MPQVQIRLPQKTLEEINRWVTEKRFKSRSDAIRAIISFCEERENTRRFFKLLMKRRAKKQENILRFLFPREIIVLFSSMNFYG